MVQRREIDHHSQTSDMILDAIRSHHCKTVQEVVDRLQKIDKSLSFEDINEAIQILEEEKKISLLEARAQNSFGNYLVKTYGAFSFWFTVATVTLALVGAYFFPQVEQWYLIRIIVGGIFILFMPGYALIELLFPMREIQFLERIILSICISLGMMPLVGLVLFSISAGITVYSVTLSISLMVVPISLVAQYRKFLHTHRTYQEIVV